MSSPELQQHTPDDFGHFFRSWIRDPLAMGAVAPSGRPLAKLMARDLRPGARVVELGAGTGTLTQAVLAKGVRPEDFYIVERDPQLVKILERRFPHCHVVAADALSLGEHLGSAAGTFDFVISGLPLVLFSPDRRRRLLANALELLKPGGSIHQFTYAGRCPVDRESRRALDIHSRLLGIAAFNLPPAFVYRLSRVQAA
jgi:phospholipid N-methyltransferase